MTEAGKMKITMVTSARPLLLLPLLLWCPKQTLATLDCYFDGNATHLVELPTNVMCTCSESNKEAFNIHDNIINQVRRNGGPTHTWARLKA